MNSNAFILTIFVLYSSNMGAMRQEMQSYYKEETDRYRFPEQSLLQSKESQLYNLHQNPYWSS